MIHYTDNITSAVQQKPHSSCRGGWYFDGF